MQRHEDGSLTTYDSFPEARAAMRALEQRVIPPILTAMTCALNKPDLFVALKKLERGSSGRCVDGTHLHDIRFEGKAEAYVSRPFDEDALRNALTDVTLKASQMNPKSAKFFSLGLGEVDELKRFLNFFLALEIHTHAVFARIDHRLHVTSLTSAVPSASAVTSSMLQTKMEALTNLFDRFVWCAACVWTDLTESDVSHFLELKKARDDIAHGRASEPPAGFARSAQLLAHKILWR
ncbi:hypothetical protein ASE11_07365 [Hydrogenophaga sp. Root209]|nr:hypothetical protein ASE11_07365 [Hydrogenophaga sp. Root209]